MTAVAKKCDDCGHYHHPKRAHTFAKAVPIKVAKETLAYMEEGSGLVASAEAWFDLKCEVCGERFEAKRRHATTCSARCRQRKCRAK